MRSVSATIPSLQDFTLMQALPICQHAAEEARLCILSASTSWGSGGPDFDDCTASDMLLMLKMWPAGPVQEAAESAGSEELREYIINVPNAQLVSLNRWIESWHLGDISQNTMVVEVSASEHSRGRVGGFEGDGLSSEVIQ